MGFSFDAGVMLESPPQVALGTTKNQLPAQAQPMFQTDLAAPRTSFKNTWAS
jgi:hypothetical protein